MLTTIYIVQWTDDKSTYWYDLKYFNDYKVATTYCEYRKEYEMDGKDFRVIQEEVI